VTTLATSETLGSGFARDDGLVAGVAGGCSDGFGAWNGDGVAGDVADGPELAPSESGAGVLPQAPSRSAGTMRARRGADDRTEALVASVDVSRRRRPPADVTAEPLWRDSRLW
jgi:hypothetical protein